MRPINSQCSRLTPNMSRQVLHNGIVSPALGSPALTPSQSPALTPSQSPALTPNQSPRLPIGISLPSTASSAHSGTHSGALAHPAQSNTAVFSVPAQTGSTPSARILVYGDSLTAGLPSFEPYAKTLASSLSAQGISVEVVGCGLCSTSAVEMARSLDAAHLKDCTGRTGPGLRRLLTEQGPFDLVMIMAGTNDVGTRHASIEQILGSLKSLHKACHAAGIPTVAISIPESCVTGTSKYPALAGRWYATNKALADWVRAEPDILFVDSAQLIPFNPAAVARGLWDPDELHFTVAGSSVLGSGLGPIVAPLLRGKDSSRSLETSKATSCIRDQSSSCIRDRSYSCVSLETSSASSCLTRSMSQSTVPMEGNSCSLKTSRATSCFGNSQLYIPHATLRTSISRMPLQVRVGGA